MIATGASLNSMVWCCDRWLFVTQAVESSPERVLVVLSSWPEQTTVFWLEHGDQGSAAKLLFDSFTKGKIANETTTLGPAKFVSFESRERDPA
jgi:hypothetical protein